MSRLINRAPRRIALLLALLHLLLACAYGVGNPLGEAPDEADHWAYVAYLALEQRLPEGPRVTQSKHPPFYHATAAAISHLGDPTPAYLRANPDGSVAPGPTQSPNFFIHPRPEQWPWPPATWAMQWARLWSALLSAGAVAAVYGLARTALPARPGVALLATGLAATLPELAFLGGAISNDTAATFFSTAALWGGLAIYQSRGRLRAGWWTPLALGLGLLTKVSVGALWPVVGLCILLAHSRPAHSRPAHSRPAPEDAFTWRDSWQRARAAAPRWLAHGLLVFVPALVMAAPWLLRNWQLYGDPTGMALVAQTIDLRSGGWGWAETSWLLRGWFLSFWGKFGGAGHIPYPAWIYALWGLLCLIGVGGWLRRRSGAVTLAHGLLAAAIVAVVIGLARYSLLALGTDQGRLLFPALGPLLILLAAGLARWPWPKPAALGTLLIGSTTALALYGLLGVIRPAFAPPPPPTPAELTAMTRAAAPIVMGEITLLGWQLADAPTLYWHAPTAPTQDWRVTLRITAEDGSLVWEWRRSPGYGRFATDRWPAGTTVRDAYTVGWPEWAGPGRYRVEVAAAPFGGDFVLPTLPDAAPDHPYALVGWLTRPAP